FVAVERRLPMHTASALRGESEKLLWGKGHAPEGMSRQDHVSARRKCLICNHADTVRRRRPWPAAFGVARVSDARRPQARCSSMNILIADDHSLVRQGLKQLLSAEADMAVIGEAQDAGETIALAHRLDWHV